MGRLLFWTLCAVTFAVYAAILFWSLPTIATAAGGLVPFDLRPAGYTLAEARAFLEALPADGVAFYRDVQHRLDLAFPALISLTLGFAILALLPRRFGWWRYVIGALALPSAVFDYGENHAVGLMLAAGAGGLTPALVESASQFTMLKSAFTTLAMSLLLVLLLVRGGMALARLLRGRRRPAG